MKVRYNSRETAIVGDLPNPANIETAAISRAGKTPETDGPRRGLYVAVPPPKSAFFSLTFCSCRLYLRFYGAPSRIAYVAPAVSQAECTGLEIYRLTGFARFDRRAGRPTRLNLSLASRKSTAAIIVISLKKEIDSLLSDCSLLSRKLLQASESFPTTVGILINVSLIQNRRRCQVLAGLSAISLLSSWVLKHL